MTPLLVALLFAQQARPVPKGDHAGAQSDQSPDFQKAQSKANSKFRRLLGKAKTLSVQMEIKQAKNPVMGHATFVLERPSNLYFHLKWGPGEYTYTIDNGHATEVDRLTKTYDEYDVPAWTAPEANGSDWVASFFPSFFVSDELLLPPKCFDPATGWLAKYGVASGDGETTHTNTVKFSNYKVDTPVPDKLFVLHPPAGYTACSVPRNAPPIQIDEKLPDIRIVARGGQPTQLLTLIERKPALVAILDPNSRPSLASLATLKQVSNVGVVVLNASRAGKGLESGTLKSFYDPKGQFESELRAPVLPLFYLVDGTGKVLNVWYGFDVDQPGKFEKQISEAVAEMKQ